ncbi:MAG: hypothetical protein R3Y13_01675 [bacterium]
MKEKKDKKILVEDLPTKKSLFRSKKHKMFSIAALVIMIGAFIYLGAVNFDDNISDAEKISKEFSSIGDDNVFVYTDAKEIISLLDGYTIVLFGSSKNEYTEDYARIVNEAAKEFGIKKVLYYDFFSDRSNNNGNYELLLEELNPYLVKNDMGNAELYAPTLLVVKDGFVEYINQELNFTVGGTSSEEYWTNLREGLFKTTLLEVFKSFVGED